MRRALLASVLAVLTASPALAFERYDESQSPASAASAESAEGIAALAEAGVKVTAGVVALPLGLAGAGSVAAGGSAMAGGSVAADAGSAVMEAAGEAADFSGQPLTVSDDVVVRPQPAPKVPFEAQPASPR